MPLSSYGPKLAQSSPSRPRGAPAWQPFDCRCCALYRGSRIAQKRAALEAEDVQHVRYRPVLELGNFPNDGGALRRADEYRNVLLAVNGVGDRRRINAGPDIVAPHLLQRPSIIGREGAIELSGEHKIAGGRQHSRIRRIIEFGRSLDLAGRRIHGLEAAVAALAGLSLAADKAVTRFDRAALILEALLLDRLDDVATFDRGEEQQVELRVVCAWWPVLAAGGRRALHLALRLCARTMAAGSVFLDVLRRIVVERLPGPRIEPSGPIQLIDVLLARDE